MSTATESGSSKIGLVAGWGSYPIVVARALKRQGFQVYCLGIKDHADPQLRSLCDDYCQLGLAKMGAHIRYFRRHGVKRVTMAGKIHKVRIVGRFDWIKFLPDWTTIRTFFHHFYTLRKDRKDDSLLLAVVHASAERGIEIVPATDYAPELLAPKGQLSGPRLSGAQRKDVEFGWQIAKQMGRLDIGQSVAVLGQAVLAVEAIEGTDLCIRRAGELCSSGGFVVVKVAKPAQDMRFDVPTIGLKTVQAMVESGARVLAIEAGKTILIDQDEVARLATKHNIAIIAVEDGKAIKLSEAA